MGGRNVSVRTRAAGALLALSAALVVVVVPQVSSAAPTPSGPGFPPPGGATTSLAPAEGAPPNDGFIGKTGGSTITYAGFAGSFTHMWWGPNQVTSPNLPIPAFAFDGAIDSAGEHLAFASMSGNSATWGSGSSNLKYISGGSYTTRSVLTRFRMIATRASDNSAISWVTPAAAGVASNVGAVIPVPLASGVPQSFKVMRIFEACSPSFTTPSVGTCNIADSNWEPVNNLYNRLNTDPAIRTISSFGAGFFYNRAPSVLPGSLTTNEDTPGAIALSASDPDANPLTYTLTGGPSNGSLSGTAPNLTYTPGPNFNGSDSFTFKVNDGFVDSATAAVSITVNAVNDAPVANAGSLTLDEDTTDGVTLTGSDVEGDALTFEIVGSPANGTLDTSALPVVTYTPGLNYNGADAFTFRAFDGAAYSASVAVAITVTPVNDAPTADDQLTGTPEDIPLPITLTGADVDGDGLSFNVVTPPAHGVLTGS